MILRLLFDLKFKRDTLCSNDEEINGKFHLEKLAHFARIAER